MTSLVLAHSPLVGPSSWGGLPEELLSRAYDVVVLDVRDDDQPPYAQRYVARAALQLRDTTGPVVLVGHSGAGYLLPQLGAARRAARQPVAAYVFLDAGLPARQGTTRLSLMHAEDEAFAHELEQHLRDGGVFPEWPDVPDLRPRGLDFFTELLPFPGDWPDAPCGYVQLSPAYAQPARVAKSRGWPVVTLHDPGGHFTMCTNPTAVADALEQVLAPV